MLIQFFIERENMFNIEDYKKSKRSANRYEERLQALKENGKETDCIEEAVEGAINNIQKGQARSFVIYGEPQSGKTEMMIALTARLLDEGNKIIICLLNDSLQLLEQNLERYQHSELHPTPQNYLQIDGEISHNEECILFCKKNAKDLKSLIEKTDHIDKKIIIDDEADYATPNSKINQQEKTRINELVEQLLKEKGIYIGVTATPARLDLNDTFNNDNEKWVVFPPHDKYVGQDIFFPLSEDFKFQLSLIPDNAGDDPKHCREALFGFLVNVAYLNLNGGKKGKNYVFLVHTSRKKENHWKDKDTIEKVLKILRNEDPERTYDSYIKRIWEIAQEKHPGSEDDITKYIVEKRERTNVIVVNSDKKSEKNYKSATDPSVLFTIVIGGNIISRGVTFNNLLSMYFTRGVKNRMQQDTYIQRARMFGNRGEYLKEFELTIPSELYSDWDKCFTYHRLALSAIKHDSTAPVWLEDSRVSSIARSSINKPNVDMNAREMSFPSFDYGKIEVDIEKILSECEQNVQKAKNLKFLLGEECFPKYLFSFIEESLKKVPLSKGDASIKIHKPINIERWKDADQENISRKRGFIRGVSPSPENNISHHLAIYFNRKKQGRLFYKSDRKITSIKRRKR